MNYFCLALNLGFILFIIYTLPLLLTNLEFRSPGRNPKFSPASTAGRVKMILLTCFSSFFFDVQSRQYFLTPPPPAAEIPRAFSICKAAPGSGPSPLSPGRDGVFVGETEEDFVVLSVDGKSVRCGVPPASTPPFPPSLVQRGASHRGMCGPLA